MFTDLWAKRDSMDRIENMNAYLFRLIKNRCLDHLKHKMFEQKYIESVQTSFEIEMSLKLQSLDRFDVSDISEGNETEILVRNAINSLPRKCRDIFLLSRVEGLKYREISERLGISVNTVECQMEKLIRDAINSLPKRCRDIFLLSRMEGLKYREISERLGISVNTVECQMGIALKKLRAKLNVTLAA